MEQSNIMVSCNVCRGRRPLGPRAVTLWVLALAAVALPARHAAAQGGHIYPTLSYQNGFAQFYDGDYRGALERFTAESRSAVKFGQVRWIDSICYETMMAECYYEMGHLDRALDHYTAALKLVSAYPDWMMQCQFAPMIRPLPPTARKPIPWAAGPRRSQPGYFPTSTLMAMGRIDMNETLRQGGVVQQAQMVQVEAQEIVRCTTLAIRRRARILGPLAQHDPLFGELSGSLSKRIAPPNHWSEAWSNIQYGLTLAATGREGQAVQYLQRSVAAAGEFDHPMTCVAEFELGRLAMVRGDRASALTHFNDATCSAVYYNDYGVLEEAFRYGALVHLLANRKGIYPPLAAALQWAKVGRLRQLQASLLLLGAEANIVLGQTASAAELLDQARQAIGTRAMNLGRIGARRNYLVATALYQQRKPREGDAALSAAMAYMQHGSHWLMQIAMVDADCSGGAATLRSAVELYQDVLRDPGAADWASDPMESMAVLTTPHPLPLEHWFEMTMARREFEAAVTVADRARRHRFFSSLPLGGRIESLRWVLEGPADRVDKASQLQRQDLLARYPAYAQLQQQAQQLRSQLGAMPLVAEDREAQRKQSQQLSHLVAVSQQQEGMLREMAVRREGASMVMPPLRETAEIQKSLPDGHAMLIFFSTSQATYGFLLNNQRYGAWRLGPNAAVTRQVASFLRDIGNFQSNHELTLKDLADTKWKKSACDLLDAMLKGSRADFTKKFDELIVVPDGALWYLPFGALGVQTGGHFHPLISRFRIRYAPTASLATLPNVRPPRPTGNTAVVVGKLYGREDDAVAKAAFERLAAALPGTVALRPPAPGPCAVYRVLMDRLVVLDDIAPSAGPYDWIPLGLDRGKPGSTLGDWLASPLGGPDQIVLPGLHTAAEDPMKRIPRRAAGNELFLATCGLMATGTRTALVSRWRMGGQTAFDLVREFAQELPHTTPADAWQRAVLVAAGSRLNLDAEPRIKHAATEETPPRANHPMFWAGYMLVDCGGTSAAETAPVKAPEPIQQPVGPPGPAPGNPPAPVGPPAADNGRGPPAEVPPIRLEDPLHRPAAP